MEGATSAKLLDGTFPNLDLPIQAPFEPMEARTEEVIPAGQGWQYEPKWDGFRCLAFRDGDQVILQSKSGQPLSRYFPELVIALQQLYAPRFVLDGELVILRESRLSFDDLLMRIHPAKSRIDKLSTQTPCTFVLFDLLVDGNGSSLLETPLRERRSRLEELYKRSVNSPLVKLSTATAELTTAQRWLTELGESGCDGVVAKALNGPYQTGERAMRKIKRIRSADCVVGGFRFASKGGSVGSLLLGLYGDDGLLHHIGFTSSFSKDQRSELIQLLKPYMGGTGFTGNAPGGPSRWSTERSAEWERLKPELVAEVSYDHFSGGRFRHGTRFLRWRPDKQPQSCKLDQLQREALGSGAIHKLLAA